MPYGETVFLWLALLVTAALYIYTFFMQDKEN